MSLLPWFVVVAAGQLTLSFVAQLIVFRLFRPPYPALTLLRLSGGMLALGFVLALVAGIQVVGLPIEESIVAAVGASGCALAILAVYCILGPTMADRSVSVFMLIRLMRSPDGAMGRHALYDAIDFPKVYDKRVTEHAHVGALRIQADGTLVVTPKGRRIARLFLAMVRLLRLDENL
jgi:hypothetical protein